MYLTKGIILEPTRVVVNILDFDIVVCEFELCYDHSRTNTFWKGNKILIPVSYGIILLLLLLFYKDGLGIK